MNRYLVLFCVVGLLAAAGCSEDRSPTNSPLDASSTEADGMALVAEDEAQWEQMADAPAPAKRGDGMHPAHVDGDHGVGPTVRTYEIVLENLTPDTGDGGSQPFSPPVLATHNRSVRMFRVGQTASYGLAQIAQDAVNGPMVTRLEGSRAVHQVVEGDGVVFPGASATYTIETAAAARTLSMAFMLVNTNDGFSGLDAVHLPRHGDMEIYLHAYDAGSEENTELASDIPGPCCGSPGNGTPTYERIAPHAGIRGDADLDVDKYGWHEPVARLTIRRLTPAYEITLENLTPATGPGSSQVFSPPVLATHNRGVRMFRVGKKASEELAQIAEDAVNTPMLDLLNGSHRALDVQEGGGVIFPGESAAYAVETAPGFRRLSMAFMLVNTNDGFSGADALFLPRSGRVGYYLGAYDAGSEENTELTSDIPGPCCGSPGTGTATHERIHPHLGILGTGDLDPAIYDWEDPVAELTVTRVR